MFILDFKNFDTDILIKHIRDGYRDLDGNIVNEILEGGADFIFILNGEKIFSGICMGKKQDSLGLGWGFLNNLNNGFYDLLKTGRGKIYIAGTENQPPFMQSIYINIQCTNEKICFSANRNDCDGMFEGINKLKGQTVELGKAVDEVIRFLKSVRAIFKTAFKKLAPDKINEYMELTFKHYSPWFPFEEEWTAIQKPLIK